MIIRPLAVRSKSANSVWAAHVVQALVSLPAVRRAVEGIDTSDERLAGQREFFSPSNAMSITL
jgi:hypothetical protein